MNGDSADTETNRSRCPCGDDRGSPSAAQLAARRAQATREFSEAIRREAFRFLEELKGDSAREREVPRHVRREDVDGLIADVLARAGNARERAAIARAEAGAAQTDHERQLREREAKGHEEAAAWQEQVAAALRDLV